MNPEDQLLTVDQVAKILAVDSATVIRRFENYPGVVDVGPRSREQIRRGRRPYRRLRIPRSVLNRFLYERKIHGH